MVSRVVGALFWILLALAVVLSARGSKDIYLTYIVIGATLACGTWAMFFKASRWWRLAFLVLAAMLAFAALRGVVSRVEIQFREFAAFVLLGIAYAQWCREQLKAALDAPMRQSGFVILVNVGVLAAMLLACEGMVRLFVPDRDPERAMDTQYGNPFWFQFQPFLMFSMDADVDIKFKNGRLPGDIEIGHLKTNNMGFRISQPVRFDTVRKKASNERVVLFTGGSAAWGAGASSNDKTIAERLEAHLNESQSKYRYVVISLSSGGWIAMQSMIAITMYGPNFDPDWVVGMDGNNDIVAACAEGYGAGRDGFSNQFDKYFRSYLHHQPAPPFYRGAWENELVRVSLLYRLLTGKRYVPGPFQFFASWNEVERSLVFYELAWDRLFRVLATSKVKVLMSSQPYKNIFRRDFEAGPLKLAELAQRYAANDCRTVPHLELMRYFHPRLRQVSEALVARWKDRIDVRYLDMTDLMPEDEKVRLDFSWGGSPVHLSDRGQDFVARIYARTILGADFGKAERRARSARIGS